MTITLPPRPVAPVPPPTVAAEMRADRALWNALNGQIGAALGGRGDHVALEDLADQLRAHLLHRPVRNEQERTERDQWELAVRKFNEQAAAYNAALQGAQAGAGQRGAGAPGARGGVCALFRHPRR